MQKLQNLSSLLFIEDAGKNTGARLFIISLESLEDVGKLLEFGILYLLGNRDLTTL
jgi:hypothetical protein